MNLFALEKLLELILLASKSLVNFTALEKPFGNALNVLIAFIILVNCTALCAVKKPKRNKSFVAIRAIMKSV